LAGDTTLQQFSDSLHNSQKDLVGRSFKLLEYKTEKESKLGDKKGFEIVWEEKQGKRNSQMKIKNDLQNKTITTEKKSDI
jgi:hypothetical protein